jgi:hypothetical protein
VPWFRIQLRGVGQGHAWYATNEEEVLQNFVRGQPRSLQYRRLIRIIKERD